MDMDYAASKQMIDLSRNEGSLAKMICNYEDPCKTFG